MIDAPVLLIVAGPNGSGETTLTRQLRASGVDLGFYINPDEIAGRLNGSYEERVSAAQREADALRRDCLRRGVSFASRPSCRILRKSRCFGRLGHATTSTSCISLPPRRRP